MFLRTNNESLATCKSVLHKFFISDASMEKTEQTNAGSEKFPEKSCPKNRKGTVLRSLFSVHFGFMFLLLFVSCIQCIANFAGDNRNFVSLFRVGNEGQNGQTSFGWQ